MESKLSKLRAAWRSGNKLDALRIAAKFPRLGDEKVAITRAWAAATNPDFYTQIGQDPEALIAEGYAALNRLYDLEGTNA